MNSVITEITSEELFDEFLSKTGRHVVYFFASWAEPCVAMSAVFAALSSAHSSKLQFARIECDANPLLMSRMRVSSVPTFVFLSGKREVARVTGAKAPALTRRVSWLMSASAEDLLRSAAETLVNSAEIVLAMKGTTDAPRCGFSRQMVQLLREENINFTHFDILADENMRAELKKLSDWPTYPQLYVKGKLVGGLDILRELRDKGNLAKALVEENESESGAAVQAGKETRNVVASELLKHKKGTQRPSEQQSQQKERSWEEVNERLEKLVRLEPIMLFMKGSPAAPQCGFSKKIVALLNGLGVVYGSFDILEDNEVRQGLKRFAQWPTFPQLYAKGEFLGGLDIVTELANDGVLLKELKLAEPQKLQQSEERPWEEVKERLQKLVTREPVMLFLKGSPAAPQCGFSKKIVSLLDGLQITYGSFDILTDNEVRQGLKRLAEWPTFPQLYSRGELIGGLDIVAELANDGMLFKELALEE